MNERHWQNWLVAAIGAWLVISNWVLNYPVPETAPASLASTIFWNAIFTGAVALVLGVASVASFKLWEEWADVAIGLWLIASAWVLGFAGVQLAMWNVVLCGVIIILSAAWAIYDVREAGHA